MSDSPAGNTANDYDSSVYHYLFELYTIEHELFRNRAYIYTLIETTGARLIVQQTRQSDLTCGIFPPDGGASTY